MSDFPETDLNKIKRVPKRGHYDRETLYSILDDAYVCHIGYLHEGRPVVIPTAFGRDGGRILIHGSTKSRLIQALGAGAPCCVTVMHNDGLVLARSVFHHSMNYRTAVIHGNGELVTDEKEKMEALRIITENIIPGRWKEARIPNEKELKATGVVAIPIEIAASKIRAEGVKDEPEDYELPYWAGILPTTAGYSQPIPDPKMDPKTAIPESVKRKLNQEK